MSGFPTISVIVPVYRAADYLLQCVDSILCQTYTDFELILVDDGSPDQSGVLCDAYAGKDPRVRVIHQANGGVSSARNAGLDHAQGTYAVFIDSDDHVGSCYLSSMLEVLDQSAAAMEKTLLITDYQPFTEEGPEQREFPNAFILNCSGGSNAAEQFRSLVFGFRIFPPYCKLYRRDIIESAHLRFDTKLKSAEDFDFNIRYLAGIDRIIYMPQVQYFYRVGYKAYVPSNRGVLGESEIRSAHLMAHGMTDFAKRLGIYDAVYDELCLWAAKKHYFNRLPMLFRKSSAVGIRERRRLYQTLTADPVYRGLYREGIRQLAPGSTRAIASTADLFSSWAVFYALLNAQKN